MQSLNILQVLMLICNMDIINFWGGKSPFQASFGGIIPPPLYVPSDFEYCQQLSSHMTLNIKCIGSDFEYVE